MRIQGEPFIDIVLAGDTHSPDLEFIAVEDNSGRSIGLGTMVKREDGFWAIRFNRSDVARYLGP